MRFLLVYGPLRDGGIETLLLRLTNHLCQSGNDVALFSQGGDLLQLLDKDVETIRFARTADLVAAARTWLRRSPDPVTLLSFDPISAARGLAIETIAGSLPRIIHICGVFHPKAFFMEQERPDRIRLNRLVAKAVGDPFIFYMNAECRDEHAARWRADLSSCAIITLPITERAPRWRASGTKDIRIASVGRLVDFKAYALGAPEIVRDCADRGLAVTWDIFGNGPLKERIEAEISRCGVADRVRLKGHLAYEHFDDVVSGYDLFIGMGTAALEAAMLGVPTLVATYGERRSSYGYLNDLPSGNVGERQESAPSFDLADLIAEHATKDEAARLERSREGRRVAMSHSLPAFVSELNRLVDHAPAAPNKPFKAVVARLYRVATESAPVRLLRSLHLP